MRPRTRASAAQALVEFALVLPLLVVLSLGLVQVVLYAHARDVLLSSVQEGARLAAEDGRLLDDGYARAETLLSAGLGTSLDALQLAASLDDDLVAVRADAWLRPILPLPLAQGLPLHAEARVTRERFRPGGGGR
ncbi:MAG TPA: TadE/TadG family type IV pilus assembly protein [Chloroflexota bacterium]|nr:TadE/TadG family type IV pilus assembly protein [Chloroflexota bacterium]